MELTISDLRDLISPSAPKAVHPLSGQWVVAVLPHGFVFVGKLHDMGGRYRLSRASNIRYWAKRNGGLPELARSGPVDGDKIDAISEVYFDSALFFYPAEDCWNA